MDSRPGFANYIPQQKKNVPSWVSSDTSSSFRKLSMWSPMRSQWQHVMNSKSAHLYLGTTSGCAWREPSGVSYYNCVLLMTFDLSQDMCYTNIVCFVFLYIQVPSSRLKASVTCVLSFVTLLKLQDRPVFSHLSQFITIQGSWAQHG